MTACLTLVVASEVVVVAFWLVSPFHQGPTAWSVLVFASAVFAAALVLAGGALVRRRMPT